MFLLVGGELLGCGENYCGQLGLGHMNRVLSFTSMNFPFPSPIYQFVRGEEHNLVLLENGDIYVWGNNYYGQLGLGDRNDRLLPTQLNFPFPSPVVRLFSKSQHNFALLENRDVYGWGRGSKGVLGLGCGGIISQPTKLNFLFPSSIRSIHCGVNFTLFLLNNESIYVCGYNKEQLGLRDEKERLEPTRLDFKFPSPIRDIKCGYFYSLVLLESNEIYTFGNAFEPYGSSDIYEVLIPTKIDFSFPSEIQNIYCGGFHSYILLENNQLFGLGENRRKELGLRDTSKGNTFVLIPISFPIEEFYCDFTTAFVISSSNNQKQLYGWGNNQGGDLGLGDKEDRFPPILIPLSASDIKFPPSPKNQWNASTHRLQSSKNRERIETFLQLHHESVPFLILEEIIQFSCQ